MMDLYRPLMDVGPNYYPDPSQHNFEIPELNQSKLQGISRMQFGVEYLSARIHHFPSTGILLAGTQDS